MGCQCPARGADRPSRPRRSSEVLRRLGTPGRGCQWLIRVNVNKIDSLWERRAGAVSGPRAERTGRPSRRGGDPRYRRARAQAPGLYWEKDAQHCIGFALGECAFRPKPAGPRALPVQCRTAGWKVALETGESSSSSSIPGSKAEHAYGECGAKILVLRLRGRLCPVLLERVLLPRSLRSLPHPRFSPCLASFLLSLCSCSSFEPSSIHQVEAIWQIVNRRYNVRRG